MYFRSILKRSIIEPRNSLLFVNAGFASFAKRIEPDGLSADRIVSFAVAIIRIIAVVCTAARCVPDCTRIYRRVVRIVEW